MAELYSQVLDLKEKDVFLETEINDTRYFSVTGIPSTLSYGKHPFSITFNDPEGQPLLKNLSNIVFEFVDSRGTVVFSDLLDIEELSGAGNGVLWIKKDPLRTADEIADGPVYLYVMGELGGDDIPEQWKGIYNVRSTFLFDARKDFPNTSNLVLKNTSAIQTNLNISESIEFDTTDSVFKRSFINVSLTNLDTDGGKIESVELAYNEQSASNDEYEIITRYPLTSGSYEITDQTKTSGLNPITNTSKIITPKQFRRNTSVRFRLRFVNLVGQLAQYLNEDRQGEIVEVTSSFITFEGSPHIIEQEDNLLKGSMYTGNAVGKGFEQSGKNSAYLKTVDYDGFISASVGSGSAGIMFFSGSVLPDNGDSYDGVGLELHGGKGSGSFRFRTNPSLLEIQANTFFVGSETSQFISGSGGSIEISSSDFHLTPEGNVTASAILLGKKSEGQFLQFIDDTLTVQGTITANSIRTPATIAGSPSTDANASSSITVDGFATFKSASIGGFIINPTQIRSTESSLILNSDGRITGSAVLFGNKGDGQFLEFSDDTLTVQGDITANNIRTPATIAGTPSTDANASASINTQGFAKFVSASIGGFDVGEGGFTLGGSNVSIDSTNKVISINNSTFGNTGIQLDFNGGTPRAFIGKSGGEFIKFDGSSINISSSAFFIGGGGQFISGANQNIEISSSAFHLDPRNNILVISGTINANVGNIGDFQIIDGKISGSNITFDANRSQIFKTDQGPGSDTSAAFNQLRDEYYIDFTPSASNDLPGTDYYIKMDPNFMVDKSGILIASGGLFEGTISASAGSIGGFLIESSSIRSKGGTTFISGSPSSADFFIKSPNFNIKGSGNITGSSVLFTGGKIGGFTLDNHSLTTTGVEINDSTQNIFISSSAFKVDILGNITGSQVLFTGGKIAGFDINGTKLQQDGSFHLDGNTSADFFISASNFQVTPSGDITGSSALFDGNTTIGGTLTVNGTGEIAGFGLTQNAISSSNNKLILKSNGQITGSDVIFTGGKIADFSITSTQISDSDGELILKSNGQITASAANIIGKVTSTAGAIGGFTLEDNKIKSLNSAIELNSTLAGLFIKDGGGTDRVIVKSGSLGTVGGGTQYIKNQSFEDDSISAGRNFVSTINSWSFSEGGGVNISLTDRSSYPDDEKAVSGDVTLDVVVPAGSGNYSSPNTYEISQVITASIAQGDTLSFSSVARFSSSFGGRGKDRALGPQYFRLEYSGSGTNGFVPFLPENEYTASNGYGEYFLGSGQYSSFGASADLPSSAEFLRLVLTGSINDDTGFTIEKPLFAGDKGTVNSDLKGKKFTKTVLGSTTAEFPETEITFDNFSVRSNTRRVELTEDGLLIYNSEDSFFKMSGAGIEIKGGSGVASFGSSINRESFTNDSQVAGTLGAPALQAYQADPNDIGTVASDGNVAEYAKGNHVHRLTFSTLNTILGSNTITNGIWNSGFGSTAGASISGSFTAPSSSFSTRTTNLETASGSFSSRVTTLEGLDTDDDLNFAGDSGTGTIDFDSETFTIAGGGGMSSVASGNSITLNLDTGILSSSAQISSNISGSFTAPSSSFSTRTADLESASGSFSSRVTTLEAQDIDDDLNFAGDSGTGTIDFDSETLTIAGVGGGLSSTASGNSVTFNLSSGILSSSSQINSQISGSLGPNASVIRGLTNTRISGSLGPNASVIRGLTNTRISGSLGTNATFIRGLTEVGVSGSFTAPSSSFSTRVTDLKSASGSFSSRVTTLEGQDIDDDLTIAGDSGGNLSINMDSETLTIAGGTGVTTSGNTNTITIDSNDSEIVHDNLSGFVANEHIDHSSVSVIAGSGLTGGGTIAANRTLDIGAGTGVTVNANDVAIGQAVATSDNVTFGSVTTTGNISGSSTSTGSFGSLIIDDAIQGVTTFRDIGSAHQVYIDSDAGGVAQIGTNTYTPLSIRANGNQAIYISQAAVVSMGTTNVGNLTSTGTIVSTGANALISGSSTSTGSFGAGYIDNKLGIGTTSPEEEIHIVAGNASIKLEESGGTAGRLIAQGVGSGLSLYTTTSSPVNIATNVGGPSADYTIRANTDKTVVFQNSSTGYDRITFSAASSSISSSQGFIYFEDGQNISGSATSTGSFGMVHTEGVKGLAGDYSSVLLVPDTLQFGNDADSMFRRRTSNDVEFRMAGSDIVRINTSGLQVENGNLEVESGNVIASGNISGSATSTGSFGAGYIDNKLGIGTLVPTENLHVVGELAIEETSAASGKIKFRDTDQAVLGQIGIARTTNDIGSNSVNLDMVYRLEYNNKFMWNQQNTTRMVLNEHGLGINATPADDIRLRVGASDNDDGIRLDDQSGNQLFKVFQQSDGVGRLFVGGSSSGTVFTVTGGADASYVNAGRFGVGVTSPTTELDVSGSLQVSGHISGSSTSTGSFGHVKIPDGNIDIMNGNDATRVGIGKHDNNNFYVGANTNGSAAAGGNLSVKVGIVDSGGNVRSDWVFGADRSFKSVNQNVGDITMGGTTFKMDSTYNDVKIQMGYDTVPFVLNKPIYNLADVEFIQDEKKNIKFFEDAQTGGEIMQLYRGGINVSNSGNISGSSTSTGSFGRLVASHDGGLHIGNTIKSYYELSGWGLRIQRAASTGYAIKLFPGSGASYAFMDLLGGVGIFKLDGTEKFRLDSTGINVKSGNISGSATSTGSFGRLELAGKSSTNSTISVQDGVNNGILRLQGSTRVASPGSYIQLYGPNGSYGSAVFNYGYAPGNSTLSFTVDGNEKIEFHGTGTITTQGNLISQELNGLISGSSTSTGSFGKLIVDDARFKDDIFIGSAGTSGFRDGSDTNISVYIANTARFKWYNNGGNIYFGSTNASGPNIYSAASSTTNATYRISGTTNTGWGGGTDKISGIIGGTEVLQITANKISGSSTSTGSFGKILQNGQEIAIGQSVGTTDDVTFGSVTATGNITSTGTNPRLRIQETDASDDFERFEIEGAGGSINFNTRNSAAGYVSTDYQITRNASGASIHRWFIGGTERLYLNSSKISGSASSTGSFGAVSIGKGTADNQRALTVVGNAQFDNNAQIYFKRSNGTADPYISYDSSNNFNIFNPVAGEIRFAVGSGYIFDIESTGINFNGSKSLTTSNGAGVITVNGNSGVILKSGTGGGSEPIQFMHGSTVVSEVTSTMAISGSATSTGSFGHLHVAAVPGTYLATLGNFGLNVKGDSNSTGTNFRVRDGSGNTRFNVHGYGQTGIGTDSAQTMLHIVQNSTSLQNGIGEYIRLQDSSNYSASIGLGANGDMKLMPQGGGVNIASEGSSPGNLTVDGKVHIGSTGTPTNHLEVEGTIYASGNISGSSSSTGSFGHLVVDDAIKVAHGGTGATSLTSNSLLTGNGTSAIVAEGSLAFDGSTLEHSVSGGTVKMDFSGGGASSGYNYFMRASNDGGVRAVHFVNGSARSADNGPGVYTIRNDGGELHLGRTNYITTVDGSTIRMETGNVVPGGDDAQSLGTSSLRWSDVFAVQTTTGGVFETGLKTEKIGDNPTGTIVSWREDGLVPCDSNEDELVMGVIKEGKDEPIVMGAEPVLVTGKVNVGDYIVTSDKIGHGKSVKRGYLLKKDLFGKVIAQALEPSDDSDSCLIKCMIRKM